MSVEHERGEDGEELELQLRWPFRTTLSERDYARVRQLGNEYRARVPRSVLR